LVPKYIGPYHILKDFSNELFQLELPASLKSRGIHNVFHALLLRIHILNDNHLFPGHAENQIGLMKDSNSKWAVDQIKFQTDTLFQIK
ncbi:hypothetical protein ARMSODRAFT_882035, partial [Armillaria solidipes]